MIRPRIIIAAAGQWRLSEASVRAWRHTHTHLVARLLLFNEKLWGTSVLPLARCLFGGKTVRDWVSWFCEECARQSGIIIAIRRREEAEEAGGGSLVLEAIAARQDDMSTIGRWVVVAARPPRALSPECGGSFFSPLPSTFSEAIYLAPAAHSEFPDLFISRERESRRGFIYRRQVLCVPLLIGRFRSGKGDKLYRGQAGLSALRVRLC